MVTNDIFHTFKVFGIIGLYTNAECIFQRTRLASASVAVPANVTAAITPAASVSHLDGPKTDSQHGEDVIEAGPLKR